MKTETRFIFGCANEDELNKKVKSFEDKGFCKSSTVYFTTGSDLKGPIAYVEMQKNANNVHEEIRQYIDRQEARRAQKESIK
jgi:hypothetical protein